MRKFFWGLGVVILSSSFLHSATSLAQVQVEAATTQVQTPAEVDTPAVLDQTQQFILQQFQQSQPTFSSEWLILALARNGYAGYQSQPPYFALYYGALVKQLQAQNGKLSAVKYTEYSRVALALAAIGKDPQAVGGYNLFDDLSDFDQTTAQGINGAAFALLAVDSRNEFQFTQPAGVTNYTTKEKLLTYLLAHELPQGGFSLAGQMADVDVTAMTLQALAPHQNDPAVKAAVARGVAVLAQQQQPDGGFRSNFAGSQEAAESSAQVVTALSSLGIDSARDPRFVKQKSALQALSDYQVASGGFSHTPPATKQAPADGLATEQAAGALVAYERWRTGKTNFYQMNDVTSPTDQESVQAVTDLLQTLDDDPTKIAAARAAYDALTEAQKKLIPPSAYQLLTAAEAQLAKKTAAQATTSTAPTVSTTASQASSPLESASEPTPASLSATKTSGSVPQTEASAPGKNTQPESTTTPAADSSVPVATKPVAPVTQKVKPRSKQKQKAAGWQFTGKSYQPKAAATAKTPASGHSFWQLTPMSGLAFLGEVIVAGILGGLKFGLKKGIWWS